MLIFIRKNKFIRKSEPSAKCFKRTMFSFRTNFWKVTWSIFVLGAKTVQSIQCIRELTLYNQYWVWFNYTDKVLVFIVCLHFWSKENVVRIACLSLRKSSEVATTVNFLEHAMKNANLCLELRTLNTTFYNNL